MQLGNIIIIILLVVYTYQLWGMYKVGWTNLKIKTKQINEIRNVPIKTIEEQKAFLDILYPKTIPQKKTFIYWGKLILSLLMGMCIYIFYSLLLGFFNIIVPLWLALVILFTVPLLISIIMNKCGVDDGNVLVNLFRRNKK